ncbi:hypothetical protein T484DRAFT_1755720 [Baffinella frigidus]|nr:hypothetical protein T484DRAFT_1755720 [Cryptophyta sp. CCMP2293]
MAAVSDNSSGEYGSEDDLLQLLEKREVVERVLHWGAWHNLALELVYPSSEFGCTCSRDGVVFADVCSVGLEGEYDAATDHDWNRVLSEGLGTKFNIQWHDFKYSDA